MKMVEDDMYRETAINENEVHHKKKKCFAVLNLVIGLLGYRSWKISYLIYTKPSDCTRGVCIVAKFCCLEMYSETRTKENIRRHTGGELKKVHFENVMLITYY
jgi:hypothetical protein